MKESVDAGYAYRITLDDEVVCFLYGVPSGWNLCAVSFWTKLKRYAAAGYMFIRDNTRLERIYWNPHHISGRMPLGYLLDNRIITDYRNGAEFVSIRIPDTKLEELTKREIHKCGITEV